MHRAQAAHLFIVVTSRPQGYRIFQSNSQRAGWGLAYPGKVTGWQI